MHFRSNHRTVSGGRMAIAAPAGAVMPLQIPDGPLGSMSPGAWQDKAEGSCRRVTLVTVIEEQERSLVGRARPPGTDGQWDLMLL